MRKIKFNAYCEKTKQYIRWDDTRFFENTQDERQKLKRFMENYSNWKLLQYTGSKDNNHKEIYEGDLIKYSHFDRFDKKQEGIYEVKFINSAFMMVNKDGLYLIPNENGIIEVIGNIFK